MAKKKPTKKSKTKKEPLKFTKTKNRVVKKKRKKAKKKVRVKTKRMVKKKVKFIKPIKSKKIKKVRELVEPTPSDETIHRTRIRVIGIGGGGGTIISEIVSRIKRADFVVANTDSRALKAVRRAKRFQFGQTLTRGLGTGMNTEMGETAAQNEKEKIKDLFEEQDLCIIIACLGGGTGSGATSIFAKISKSSGCLTYGIFTLPFEFEGDKKMEIAKESLEKIKPNLNAYSVIPNERIFKIIDKNTPLKSALSAINKKLAKNLEGLIEMICLPGLINIDFADLKTILKGRGRLTYLNTTEIEEPDKEEAAKKVISTPLYPYTIKGARGILYNLVGGKGIQLSRVSEISEIISDLVNKNAKIIFGISQNQKHKDKIKITLLATGCGIKSDLLRPARISKPVLPRAKKPKPHPTFRKKSPTKQTTQKVVRGEKKISRSKIKISKKLKPRPIPKPSLKPQPTADQPKADQPKAGKPKPKKKVLPKKKRKKKTQPPIKSEIPRQPLKSLKKKKETIEDIRDYNSRTPIALQKEQGSEGIKIRRNALQLKKVVEEEEKELLEKEKIWETPAILRRKK